MDCWLIVAVHEESGYLSTTKTTGVLICQCQLILLLSLRLRKRFVKEIILFMLSWQCF